ncbi:unnamed protein product [Urochloa decumbens]|uniref:F-box domain-containing protein n=1 Tax=Urochloa decumbens TaxID=240449 RepID=A0ABC8VHD0_9POAL
MAHDEGARWLAVAAANYGALPTDVLYDMLLRLPAKELCRLRVVCRSWRSLTSDPLFARAHSRCHSPHAVVLGFRRVVKRIPMGHRRGEVLSTHGDLLCVSHGWALAYVLNLTTGAVVADITVESRNKVNRDKPMCVMGHVPSTGEYKLLRIQSPSRDDYNNGMFVTPSQTSCQIMTLGDGGGQNRPLWRSRPRPPVLLSCWSVAIVAGVAYFLLQAEGGEAEQDSIAVFDMATEKWKPRMIQGPLSSSIILSAEEVMYPTIYWKQFRLARLNERLVTVYCNFEESSTELWLLVHMDESIWIKKYTLQGTRLFWDEHNICYHHPLTVLDDGRIIIVWVDRPSPAGSLSAYDPRTSTWADLATVSGDVVMHHGSLLCPNLSWG